MTVLRTIAALLLFLATAPAQTARIAGRVTDRTGAVVPGASVTVTNSETGAERKVAANEEGYYAAPLLLPGEYRVTVEHAGFKPITRAGVKLDVDQRAELDFDPMAGPRGLGQYWWRTPCGPQIFG